MSIKLLIVDDEPIICQGLRHTIPWETLGIEVIGEAYNGIQALELLNNNKVDIVLTDVKMPKMDGLALAKAIKRDHPNIHIVIISGYEEFDYAKKAIRLGVEDYLTKPVNIDELLGLMKQITVKIADKTKNTQTDKLYRFINEQEELVDFGPPINPKKPYRLILSQLKIYGKLIEVFGKEAIMQLREHWQQKLEHALKVAGFEFISVFTQQNLFLTIVYRKSGINISDDELVTLFEKFTTDWQEVLPLIFAVANNQDNLRNAYKEAQISIYHAIATKQTAVIYSELIIAKIDKKASTYLEKEIINALLASDEVKLKAIVANWVIEAELKNEHIDQLLSQYREIKLMVIRHLQSIGLTNPKVSQETNKLDLNYYNSYELLEEQFTRDMLKLLMLVRENDLGKNYWAIEKAKKYISEHYREDLKAKEIADLLHITPNYFSQMFKHETGKNFTEYINDLRMTKAKELLADTTNRVFEIAEQVGFKEYKYFAQVFKKMTGLTPTDYRNHIMKSGGN